MILLLHITIALASIGYTTYLYIKPSQNGLRVAAGLLGTTLASGTYLVVSKPTNMVETCVMGLAYLGAVSLGMLAAQRKLAAVSAIK